MGAADNRELKIAIVGATGTVGSQLLELIEVHGFPYSTLGLFAEEEGSIAGEKNGNNYDVEKLDDPSGLATFDVAFLAVPADIAREIIRSQPGPVLVDLSGAGISVAQVPPVAPGLTSRQALAQLAERGTLSIADPSAHALATIIQTLDLSGSPVSATLLVSAGSVSKDQVQELAKQSVDLMNARLNLEEDEEQIAFSVSMPEHERAICELIAAQTDSLLGRDANLTLQILVAPVFHGTALAISSPEMRDRDRARERLRGAPGLLLLENSGEMRSTVNAVGQDAIVVHLLDRPRGLAACCFFDNARLAALSALWAAENLASRAGAEPS